MIECIRGEEVWHTYTYNRNGVPFGFAKWRKQEDSAEFHNGMHQHTKSALLESRSIFDELKVEMALAGCTHVVVLDTNDKVDSARLKYWKFMGFVDTGSAFGYTFAVQGVSCQQYQQ